MIISKKMELSGDGFNFEFGFNICKSVGLVYDYNLKFLIMKPETQDGYKKQHIYKSDVKKKFLLFGFKVILLFLLNLIIRFTV